ncbi:MAG TPA: hypothetical protein VNH44_11695 [Micropepsaceae bacterium]|nr:hypothetical protein [Micropepsaceae bacterium]
MKSPALMAVLAAALSLATVSGTPSFAQINQEHAKVAPDEKSAIAIAEKAALPLIGGEDKLAIARPFRATGHGDIWLVISQPVPDPKAPGAAKRSVVVQLSAMTGEILDLSTAD